VFGTGVLSSTTEPGGPVLNVAVKGLVVSTTFDLMLNAPLQITGGFTGRNDVEAFMVGSGFIGEQTLLHRD
jgi:hypothetical protein